MNSRTRAVRFVADGRLAADVVVQATLIGGAWFLTTSLRDSALVVERAMVVLTFAAGVSVTVLLAVAGWLSVDPAGRRVACAVGLYTAASLSADAVGLEAGSVWRLLGASAGAVIAALLVRARRDPSVAPGRVPVGSC